MATRKVNQQRLTFKQLETDFYKLSGRDQESYMNDAAIILYEMPFDLAVQSAESEDLIDEVFANVRKKAILLSAAA